MTSWCVTGHRPDKLGGYSPEAEDKLQRFATQLLRMAKPDVMVTGMALGWDMAIAAACYGLKIPYVAAVPFIGQESRWQQYHRHQYGRLIASAKSVHVVNPGGFSAASMQIRNEWMVQQASQVVALFDGSAGGTANCVKYANKRGVPVWNVWELWEFFK